MKGISRTLWAAACCLVVLLVAGCAASSSVTAKPETLEERVRNYMQAQIEGKWDHAYTFFHSSYRGQVTRENYVHRARDLSYKGFAIEEIDVLPSGDEATVKVRIDISYMGLVFPRAPQKQNWEKEKGEWFMKWSDKSAPFPQPQPKRQK